MKKLFSLFLILSFFSVLTAKTTIKCPPPSNVQAATVHNGVQLSWDYQTPDTVISYNDGYPSGVWNPGQYHALGVVYDLSSFSGATLEQIDFVHYSREKLAGPYLYNVHIYDMDSSKIVATIDSLTAGDAYDTPRYEIGVKLDSIAAPAHVGIFVEGISLYVDGSKVYSFPAVMSDTSTYVDSVNFYCTDARDPFYAVDPNYTNIYDAKMLGGAGDKTTNFIIDLWINYESISTKMDISALSKKPGSSWVSQAQPPNVEKSFHLSGNYKSLKEASSTPVEFKIFKGSVEDSLVLIEAVPGDQFSYDYHSVVPQNSYYFGVSAVNDSSVSPVEKVFYTHPKTLSISEARADDNGDFIPDSLGKEVWLKGVVSSPNLSESSAYYIQDAEAGLLLSCESTGLDLQICDSVFIHGTIQQELGLTSISVGSSSAVEAYCSGSPLDTVKLEILNESEGYEGRLVMLENVSIVNPFTWPAEGTDGHKQISDGSNRLDLFIDKETDIDGWTPPQGNINLVGILSQSTSSVPPFDGYRVIPRFRTDFIMVVGIDEREGLSPGSFALRQNYPNPFGEGHPFRGNPVTIISYQLAVGSDVELTIYNALGQEIKTLVNDKQEAGIHTIRFSAADLPSGVYFYKIKAGAFEQARKMLLLR